MDKPDLQEEFISRLGSKTSRKADLIDEIADLLVIERDAAYRRLSGKVSFTLREAGIVAEKYNISLDRLINKSKEGLWMPFIMAYPMLTNSIGNMYDMIMGRINRVGQVVSGESSESGNIVSSMPMEFFILSPLLSKFMFFKWGNLCVATEEFDRFSDWELPAEFEELPHKLAEVYCFDKIFYIWDQSIIWDLCRDISNFHRMGVISALDKKNIAIELKSVLSVIEKALDKDDNPVVPGAPGIDFYVSPVTLGFISHYYKSPEACSVMFETNYTFSMVEDCDSTFEKIKHWMNSFLHMSVQLSKSGRNDRRTFFNNQYKIIDYMLQSSDSALFR